MENFDDDYLENQPHDNCPNCSRVYDDIDFDYQSCSKCGYDAEKKQLTPEIKSKPTNEDYMNGDADVLTGEWY